MKFKINGVAKDDGSEFFSIVDLPDREAAITWAKHRSVLWESIDPIEDAAPAPVIPYAPPRARWMSRRLMAIAAAGIVLAVGLTAWRVARHSGAGPVATVSPLPAPAPAFGPPTIKRSYDEIIAGVGGGLVVEEKPLMSGGKNFFGENRAMGEALLIVEDSGKRVTYCHAIADVDTEFLALLYGSKDSLPDLDSSKTDAAMQRQAFLIRIINNVLGTSQVAGCWSWIKDNYHDAMNGKNIFTQFGMTTVTLRGKRYGGVDGCLMVIFTPN